MMKYLYILLFVLVGAVSCSDQNKQVYPDESETTLKVCTYNLWCAHSRTKKANANSDFPTQRFWKPSSGAMASLVGDLNCDVYAFQEVGDSIYGKKGAETSLKKLLGGGYEWKFWSNSDGKEVTATSGKLGYTPGICYKKSVVAFIDGGIFWLGGNPAKPEFVRTESFDPERGDAHRACVWARLRHIPSGKIFYFLSTHLDTRTLNDVFYPCVNEENCKNLMSHADKDVVPKGTPSIIAGDFNTTFSHDGYIDHIAAVEKYSHKWENAYLIAREKGLLNTAAFTFATTNSIYEKTGSSIIDHILVDGFDVLKYEINQKKYATEDGSGHYPSDHFPVVVKLKFK